MGYNAGQLKAARKRAALAVTPITHTNSTRRAPSLPGTIKTSDGTFFAPWRELINMSEHDAQCAVDRAQAERVFVRKTS